MRAQSAPAEAPAANEGASSVETANAPVVVREPSAGSPRGTIVFVRTADDEHVVARLRAELSASAWRVLEIGPDPRFERSALSLLATRYTARAAVRARESERKIELWVTGPGGAAETLTAPGPRADDGVLALRATEALRARGLQIDRASEASESEASAPAPALESAPAPLPAPSEPARGTAPAPAAVLTPEADEAEEDLPTPPWSPGEYARGLWLELAPALVVSPGGGFPAEFSGFVALRVQPLRLFSAALFGYLPWQSAVLRADEGSASVTQQSFGAAAYVHPRLARFEFDFGAGGLASRFVMHGHAQAGLMSAQDELLSTGVFAASSLHFNLGGGLRVSLGALCGVMLKRVVVHFGDRSVANFGRPFALVSLGLELPLLALGR